jgi:hypothetical protein
MGEVSLQTQVESEVIRNPQTLNPPPATLELAGTKYQTLNPKHETPNTMVQTPTPNHRSNMKSFATHGVFSATRTIVSGNRNRSPPSLSHTLSHSRSLSYTHTLIHTRTHTLALTHTHTNTHSLCLTAQQTSPSERATAPDLIGKEFKFKNNLSRRFWPL